MPPKPPTKHGQKNQKKPVKTMSNLKYDEMDDFDMIASTSQMSLAPPTIHPSPVDIISREGTASSPPVATKESGNILTICLH